MMKMAHIELSRGSSIISPAISYQAYSASLSLPLIQIMRALQLTRSEVEISP